VIYTSAKDSSHCSGNSASDRSEPGQDHSTGLQGSRHRRSDFLPLAQRVCGLQVEQAKKLKDLQRENAQLRRAVADLTVENSEVRVVRAHRAVQLTGGLSCLYGCDKRGNGGALRIVGLASGNIGACAMGCGAKA